MTQIYELLTRAKQKTTLGKRRGFSPILAVLILIGITVVAAGQLTGTFNDLTGTASQTANIDIIDPQLRVLGSETYISFNVKNTGTESVDINNAYVLTVDPTIIPPGNDIGPGATISDTLITTAFSLAPGQTSKVSGTVSSMTVLTVLPDRCIDASNNVLSNGANQAACDIAHTPPGTTTFHPATSTNDLKLEKGSIFAIEVAGDIDGTEIIKSSSTRAR